MKAVEKTVEKPKKAAKKRTPKKKPQPKSQAGAFTREHIECREDAFKVYALELMKKDKTVNTEKIHKITYVNHSVAHIKMEDGSGRFFTVGKGWLDSVNYKGLYNETT